MEILAPAGNIKSLISAVNSGANAIYLGIDRFNARLKADNFTAQNLSDWVEYCHMRGVKVYLTLNTNIKEREIALLEETISVAKNAKVDALIVADMAVVKLAREIAPNIPLHASTQLGIYNLYGAMCAKDLGFSRVVLSREATLPEIIDIKKSCDIEIEYFVHGAMCVSFSGGCLMSSIANGNSGNRGGCLQLCRKEYGNNLSSDKGYFLSPKDQCLIDKLNILLDSGVDSIKIEGRMKSPEYVATTVRCYSKILQSPPLTKEDNYQLKAVFNRGDFTQGYSFTDDIIYPSVQGHYGVNVGKIISCKFNGSDYSFTAEMKRILADGCGVKFLYRSKEIGGAELRGKLLSSNLLNFNLSYQLPIDTAIHVTNDIGIKCCVEKKLPIDIEYYAFLDKNFLIKAYYNGILVEYTHPYIVKIAEKLPVTEQSIVGQLSKLGNTEFTLANHSGQLDENIFIPNGTLNESRREVIELLRKAIIKQYNSFMPTNCSNNFTMPNVFTREVIGDIIELNSAEYSFNNKDTYIINYSKENIIVLKTKLIENNLYIKLPKFLYNVDFYQAVEQINSLPVNVGIYADNLSSIELARLSGRVLILGFGMNIMNSLAIDVYNCNNACLSVELNKEELGKLNGYIYSLGYLPIMTLAHCPYKVASGKKCINCNYDNLEYYDNYGKYKISRAKLNKCYFTLYNSASHNLVELVGKKYIDLSCFNKEETENYIDDKTLPSMQKITFGHFKRGVN